MLLKTLGADVVDYPLRTECCGGHMAQIGPEMSFELIRRLIAKADDMTADAMVTVCPMCQLNLDAYQGETNRFFKTNYHMPVLFFTQMMGLAFGIAPKELGFGLELVSARNAARAPSEWKRPLRHRPLRRRNRASPRACPCLRHCPGARRSKPSRRSWLNDNQ